MSKSRKMGTHVKLDVKRYTWINLFKTMHSKYSLNVHSMLCLRVHTSVFKKNVLKKTNWAWSHDPMLGRLRWENCCKFEVSLDYSKYQSGHTEQDPVIATKHWSCLMAQWIMCLQHKLKSLCLLPRIQGNLVERINSLSCPDLHS